MGKLVHGEALRGSDRSPEYRAWHAMHQRCFYRKGRQYKDYGGRGITVCERWKKYENFLADMGRKPTPHHSLDRFPNKDGDYTPGNCRWATREQQDQNRSDNLLLTYEGRTQTAATWAKELGMKSRTLRSRLEYGWPIEKALTTPVRKR